MRYFLTLILLAIATSCYGWGANAPSFAVSQNVSTPSSCGTSTVVVSDDFNVDLSGWVQDVGIWSIVSGEQVRTSSSSTPRYLRSTTTVQAACQWAEQVIGSEFSDNYLGAFLRATGETGLRYVATVRNDDLAAVSNLLWLIYDGTTLVGSAVAVINDIPRIATGSKVTYQVSGEDTSTQLHIWIDGVGNKPSDYGAADYVMQGNASTTVNAGTYVGIFSRDWTITVNSTSNFSAGY